MSREVQSAGAHIGNLGQLVKVDSIGSEEKKDTHLIKRGFHIIDIQMSFHRVSMPWKRWTTRIPIPHLLDTRWFRRSRLPRCAWVGASVVMSGVIGLCVEWRLRLERKGLRKWRLRCITVGRSDAPRGSRRAVFVP